MGMNVVPPIRAQLAYHVFAAIIGTSSSGHRATHAQKLAGLGI